MGWCWLILLVWHLGTDRTASTSTADWFGEVQIIRPLGGGIIPRSQHWTWIGEKNHGQDLDAIPRIFNPFNHLSWVPGMCSKWYSLSSGTRVTQSSVSSIDSHFCERVLWWGLVTLMLHLDLMVSALLNHAHKHVHKKFRSEQAPVSATW